MSRARDARVVVADRCSHCHCSSSSERSKCPATKPCRFPRSRADLRRGWNDARVSDGRRGVDLVAVPEDSAWGLADSAADAIARLEHDRWGLGRLIGIDQAQRLFDRIQQLHSTHDDALEGVATRRPKSCVASGLTSHRRQLVEGEAVAREWTDDVRAAVAQPAVQGIGVRHCSLTECSSKASAGMSRRCLNDPSSVDRVAPVVVLKCDSLVVALELGMVSVPVSAIVSSLLERALQRLDERLQLVPAGGAIEAAGPWVHCMLGSATERDLHLVCGFVRGESERDQCCMVVATWIASSRGNRAREADSEVRGLDRLTAYTSRRD